MSELIRALAFETPLALWAFLSLPVIWWLLRSIPPRPQLVAFPPINILLKLKNPEETPDKMPWWLLLLRLLLAAIIIAAVSHPFLRKSEPITKASGPLLLVVDDGWAAAKDWSKRQEAVITILNEAKAASRVVYVAGTSQPEDLRGLAAEDAEKLIRARAPNAASTDRMKLVEKIKATSPPPSETLWLTDSVDAGTGASFADAVSKITPSLQTYALETASPPLALSAPALAGGDISINVLRSASAAPQATVQAIAGDGRVLTEAPVTFSSSETSKTTKLSLPIELRNEVQSLIIKDQNHAGARKLLDDRWHRKTVAIETGAQSASEQPLLSSLHYVVNALQPFAEISAPANSVELKSALDAGLSVLILADVGNLPQQDREAVSSWIEKGGLLLRFAGPKLAASTDDLLPVRLRQGDRNLGSALSWETPQTIQNFSDQSPFSGIAIDPRITVSRQVLAEPDNDLSSKTWASLADGTPLITSAKKGNGRIVLFHVSANADWSNLVLTGTFVELLQRIADIAPAAGSTGGQPAGAIVSGNFAQRLLMAGTGELTQATGQVKTLSQKEIDTATASLATPAGLYSRGGQDRAVNLKLEAKDLAPLPSSLSVQSLKPAQTISYAKPLFILAALLFLIDCLATAFVGGHLARRAAVAAAALVLIIHPMQPDTAYAAIDDEAAMKAALETHLAFVKTGDSEIDQASEQGLKGLGLVMADRTSAALGEPTGIDIENDEIVFYPLLYWPVKPDADAPNPKALERIADFMKNGGTIFFDLRDASDQPNSGPAGEALRRILSKLDIPPLEPVPDNHALTKSFYLLKDFPGRYRGAPLWVEAQDEAVVSASDNVSGIIIGANDYAAAWAITEQGEPLNAVIPGDDRQREFAFRVGVNVVMYTLTGNYKTDQVHVPAILKRLGKE